MLNIRTNQIKRELGLDSWTDPPEKYPRQLTTDPVKYIAANAKAQEFIPKELKELADNALKSHAKDPKEKKTFENFKISYFKWFITYKKPSEYGFVYSDKTERYDAVKKLNEYLLKTSYNGNAQRWEFSE